MINIRKNYGYVPWCLLLTKYTIYPCQPSVTTVMLFYWYTNVLAFASYPILRHWELGPAVESGRLLPKGGCNNVNVVGPWNPIKYFDVMLYTSSFPTSTAQVGKDGPKCITCDTEVCKSIAIIRKRIAIVHEDWMAAACKLLSVAGVVLPVSPCCLALCYPWLWSRWVWLTKGIPFRPMTHCLWQLMRKVRWRRLVTKTLRVV